VFGAHVQQLIMSSPRQCDAFEGVWFRGQEKHVIRGSQILWADGSCSIIRRLRSGAICVQSEETNAVFEAQLSSNSEQLVWNNGSVWTRVLQPLPKVHEDKCESTNLQKLLAYLGQLDRDHVGTQRVLHVVNEWFLGGIIPVEHHGLILELEKNRGFLALNFSTAGIKWQRSQQQPVFPDGTLFVKSHAVRFDPCKLQRYCAQSCQFSVFGNDCKAWTAGLMKELCATTTKRTYVEVPHVCRAGAPALVCGFGGPLHAWL